MQEKQTFRGVKAFFAAWFGLLILVLTGIGIMDWLGYELIDAGATYLLFGLLVVSALVALTWWLLRKINARWMKIMTGVTLGLVTAAAAVSMYMLFTVMLFAGVPGHFTTLSNEGCSAVVMCRMQLDFDDAEKSRYIFSVHPRTAGLFYNRKISGEGELFIRADSDAQLMHEWTDARTLRLYAGGEGWAEDGELVLSFD